MYFSYFCPKTFHIGSQNEEKCQISLLPNHSARTTQAPTMEQPQCLSAKPWVFLDIFQLSPSPPTPKDLATGWVFPWASFSQALTQYLLIGWEFISIFQLSPIQCLDHEWVCPRYFTPHPSIFPTGRGQVTCSTSK